MRKILLLTFAAILIPLILFGVIGCMKKPDHTPNYGPEVDFDSIQKAAQENIPPDPLTIKLDQYVSIDVTQTIDTQPAITLSQKLDHVTVYDKSTPGKIVWNFAVEMNELSNTGVWQNSKQNHQLEYSFEDQQSLNTKNLPVADSSRLSAYSLKAFKASTDEAPVKVTYHNLTSEEGFMPVPVLVKNRADCGGVKDCNKGIRYLRITFDRVIWDSESHGTKTSYRIVYSPDIPTYIADWSHPEGVYPTNQFQFCAQTWLEISNAGQTQVVPVQQCADMRDFQFGHD